MGKRRKYFFRGILIILPFVIIVIIYYLLMFSENYIPGNIDKMMRQKVQITEDEHLPVKLIKNSISDYNTDLELLSEGNAVTVIGKEVLTSDNLKNLSERFLVATNTFYDTDFTINQLNIEVYKQKIMYYLWMKDFFYFIEYDINGDTIKRISTRRSIPFKENQITYAYFNSNNKNIEKIKMVDQIYRRIDYVWIGVQIIVGSLIVYALYIFLLYIYKNIRKMKKLP